MPVDGIQFYNRVHLDECLEMIRLHADDPQWIFDRLECTHKVLRAALETDSLVQSAIDTFLKIIHALILSDDYREGLNRTLQALLRAMDLKDSELMIQLSSVLAAYLSLSGDVRRGSANALNALRYIREMSHGEGRLRASFRVMHALSYNGYAELPHDVIDDVLALVEMVENRQLVAETHVLLANYRNVRAEDELALEHARLAVEVSEEIGERNIQFRAHIQRAAAYRLKRDFARSEQCLCDALSLSDTVTTDRSTAIALLEQAGLLFERLDFARSERLYRSAIRMLEELKLDSLLTLGKHGLGLALIRTGKLDEARTTLHEVYDEYRWNHNYYSTADIRFALATCEARAGRVKIARSYLRGAEGLARRLEESSARDYLINAITVFKQRLDSGEFDSTSER